MEIEMNPSGQYAEQALRLYPPSRPGVALRVAGDGLDERTLALLLAELNHRIRNLLAKIEAVIVTTQSADVEDYRRKVIARISSLHGLHELRDRPDGGILALTGLLEQTLRPYCAEGARVLAAGPDIELGPKLAMSLQLVFHELAMNANKYGALSSSRGSVRIHRKIRNVAGVEPKLLLLWTEHGGPQVKPPRRRGFGSLLIKRALQGYGGIRLNFNTSGLACFIVIDLHRQARVCACFCPSA